MFKRIGTHMASQEVKTKWSKRRGKCSTSVYPTTLQLLCLSEDTLTLETACGHIPGHVQSEQHTSCRRRLTHTFDFQSSSLCLNQQTGCRRRASAQCLYRLPSHRTIAGLLMASNEYQQALPPGRKVCEMRTHVALREIVSSAGT